MSLTHLLSPCILLLLVSAWGVVAQEVIATGQIPPAEQNYDLSSGSRCRLLAHRSVVLKNDNQHILVLDAGFGSFSTNFEGNQVIALDLNFQTTSVEPLWAIKKPNGSSGIPITNAGGLWASEDQSVIWYQGGHFYNATGWTESLYHIDKPNIPPWQLWQMNTADHQRGWVNVTANTAGHETAVRTFAGAAVSVPTAKKSFWLGGLIDEFTSASTPNRTIQTTNQMLVYDHTSGRLSSQSYHVFQSTQEQGQYQGNLLHLDIGSGGGYVISLMAEERPVNQPWNDTDGADGNLEVGQPVSLDSVRMYHVDSDTWFEQKTSWYNSEIPEPRTRFCAALFHDEEDGTWNIWMHGGQKLSDQDEGIKEIYVLSMPSFIWTKVETAISDTNLIRSHTCHAVGGQFIIVGGSPAGINSPVANTSCDPEYIKVLKIDRDGPKWDPTYSTKTTYSNPQSIRDVVGTRSSPINGFAEAELQNDFNHSRSPRKHTVVVGAAVGGAVGGVAVIALVAGVLFCRSRGRKRAAGSEVTARDGPTNSPPRGRPDGMSQLILRSHRAWRSMPWGAPR